MTSFIRANHSFGRRTWRRFSCSRDPVVRIELWIERDPNSGCWLWTGALGDTGYGKLTFRGRDYRAHRLSYETFVGPIPEGMYLDHLCRTRSCCNPAHLEPVTPRENTMRSPIAPATINAAKTHCPKGHSLAEGRVVSGRRCCLVCQSASSRAYRQRRAA